MKRKLLFLVLLLGVSALGLDRPATATPVCGVPACINGGWCICPAGTPAAGHLADCASWYPDCRLL